MLKTKISMSHWIMLGFRTVILCIFFIISSTSGADISPTAQTQQGVYTGRQITLNGTNINYWYGIPYAQQPVGNLRWMPPQALAKSNVTTQAFNAISCQQIFDMGFPRTEACLILNIYAPENASNLPVYVWIHGGGFYAGVALQYNAAPLVSTSIINSVPIIVVTINYRIGFLGFLADEELFEEKSGVDNRKTTGNYGILDQIMALDWIKKNIAGFGGNPEQITVGGESAGGISTTILLTTSLVSSGTFQRAHVGSGTLWPNQLYQLHVAINKTGKVLRGATNCTTLQCLRNLTVDQILNIERIMISTDASGVSAIPVIDGYVLDDILENYYCRENVKRVPLLIGSMANETTMITCPVFNGTTNSTQVQAFLPSIYTGNIIDEIPSIYGPISGSSDPLTYLNIVFTNSWMNCGSRRIASIFSKYGMPTFLYTYNHLLSGTPACTGVTHAAELPMLFPSYLPYFWRGYILNDIDQQVSKNMMLYWAHFITNSDPNFHGSPAKWDAYQNSTDNDFIIMSNPYMRNHYYYATCSRLWDRYAVTNNTCTSNASTYINRYRIFSLTFLLFALLCI